MWATQWPVIVENVTAACLEHGVRLVYLDNVYAYGRVEAHDRTHPHLANEPKG